MILAKAHKNNMQTQDNYNVLILRLGIKKLNNRKPSMLVVCVLLSQVSINKNKMQIMAFVFQRLSESDTVVEYIDGCPAIL